MISSAAPSEICSVSSVVGSGSTFSYDSALNRHPARLGAQLSIMSSASMTPGVPGSQHPAVTPSKLGGAAVRRLGRRRKGHDKDAPVDAPPSSEPSARPSEEPLRLGSHPVSVGALNSAAWSPVPSPRHTQSASADAESAPRSIALRSNASIGECGSTPTATALPLSSGLSSTSLGGSTRFVGVGQRRILGADPALASKSDTASVDVIGTPPATFGQLLEPYRVLARSSQEACGGDLGHSSSRGGPYGAGTLSGPPQLSSPPFGGGVFEDCERELTATQQGGGVEGLVGVSDDVCVRARAGDERLRLRLDLGLEGASLNTAIESFRGDEWGRPLPKPAKGGDGVGSVEDDTAAEGWARRLPAGAAGGGGGRDGERGDVAVRRMFGRRGDEGRGEVRADPQAGVHATSDGARRVPPLDLSYNTHAHSAYVGGGGGGGGERVGGGGGLIGRKRSRSPSAFGDAVGAVGPSGAGREAIESRPCSAGRQNGGGVAGVAGGAVAASRELERRRSLNRRGSALPPLRSEKAERERERGRQSRGGGVARPRSGSRGPLDPLGTPVVVFDFYGGGVGAVECDSCDGLRRAVKVAESATVAVEDVVCGLERSLETAESERDGARSDLCAAQSALEGLTGVVDVTRCAASESHARYLMATREGNERCRHLEGFVGGLSKAAVGAYAVEVALGAASVEALVAAEATARATLASQQANESMSILTECVAVERVAWGCVSAAMASARESEASLQGQLRLERQAAAAARDEAAALRSVCVANGVHDALVQKAVESASASAAAARISAAEIAGSTRDTYEKAIAELRTALAASEGELARLREGLSADIARERERLQVELAEVEKGCDGDCGGCEGA